MIYDAWLLLFLSLLTNFHFFVDAQVRPCNRGWEHYETETCVWLERDSMPLDYIYAENVCKSYGGRLVVIDSYQKQKWLENIIKLTHRGRNIWIGLKLNEDEKVYEWLKGKYVNYFNWKEGSRKDGNCVELITREPNFGKWSDRDCTRANNNFLCEKIQKRSTEELQNMVMSLQDSNTQLKAKIQELSDDKTWLVNLGMKHEEEIDMLKANKKPNIKNE